MAATHRSVEVMQPGVFALVERTLPEPGPGQLRSRVLVGAEVAERAATVRIV